MTIFEKIVSVIFIIGLYFKFIDIPGPLFTIASLLISCYYLFFGIIIFNQNKFKNGFKKGAFKGFSAFRIVGTIGLGITLALLIIFSILFSILAIPGPRIVPLILLAFIFIVFISGAKNRAIHFKKVLIRIALFLVLGCTVYYLTPYNQYNVFNEFYGDTLHDFDKGIMEDVDDLDKNDLMKQFNEDLLLFLNYFNSENWNSFIEMSIVNSAVFNNQFKYDYINSNIEAWKENYSGSSPETIKVINLSKVVKYGGYLYCKLDVVSFAEVDGGESYKEMRDSLITLHGVNNVFPNPVNNVIGIKVKQELVAVKDIDTDDWKYIKPIASNGIPFQIINRLSVTIE
jgi:hypothetical protein